MRIIVVLASCVALTGCGKNTACYGLSDREVLNHIQRAYADANMTPEMARNSRLDQKRVVAVERIGEKGDDAYAGLMFRQDDGTYLSVRLFEDCSYQTSPEVKQSDLKNWSSPLAAPRF